MSATQESPHTMRCSRACRAAESDSSDFVTNGIDSRRNRSGELSRSACTVSMQKLLAAAAGDKSLQMGFCACNPTQLGSCKCRDVLACIDCGAKQQLTGLMLECRSRRSFRCAECCRPQPHDVTTFDEPLNSSNGPIFVGLLTGLAVPTSSDANSCGMGLVRLSSSASAGIFRSLSVQQQQQQQVSNTSFLLEPSRSNDPFLLRPLHCVTSTTENDASENSAVAPCCRETDDPNLSSCSMPPLPPPRRPQNLPLRQYERLAHPPLARSRSSDGRGADAGDSVCSNRAVQSATYKVPRVRTVSDISSLNSSAFFKPIESPGVRQSSIENGDASLGHTAMPSSSLAATEAGLADFAAQATGDFEGSCSAGVKSRSDKLSSRSECVGRSVGTAHGTSPSADNVCTAADRLQRTSIMQFGVREEEEEEDNGSSTSGHIISAPLWHSWSGQELCNRLNGNKSKRNCNSKLCSPTAGQAHTGTETSDEFACDSAISASGEARVVRKTAARFGRQATATLSYAADSDCESLCFATYKPPLSTTIAERRDFGSSTSLRRATLRLSGTSMDGSWGREADSVSSSPTVSPTAAASQRQLSQHRSADCLDQLDTCFGAPAVWQPAAGASHRQLLLSHERGSPEGGKLSPTTHRSEAASAATPRHDSDSNGRSGDSADDVVRNDFVPERSALSAALLGKSDWYTDCGKGVTTADMPSSLLRWPGKSRTSSVDTLDRTLLLDRARSGCALSAPGTPSAAIEGGWPRFGAGACSHASIDGCRDSERVCDLAAATPTGALTAPIGADKETIAVATSFSGRAAAVQTAPSAQLDDCHAGSTEPSLQPGHLARPRRAVPRTNPHVFHRNVATGGESSDSNRRTAASRHCCWSRVLSDSCLVWPKVPAPVPASSPISSSSDLSAAAVTGAAIIATICDNRNERQHLTENCNLTSVESSGAGSSDPSGSRQGAPRASTDCCDSSDDVLSWADLCRVGFMTSADDGRHCRRLAEGESYV